MRSGRKGAVPPQSGIVFSVFNQSAKGENKIFIGEDAYPYAGDGILLVADGVGGRGGYLHAGVDNRIGDSKNFYNLVFEPVLGETDEDYKNYVMKNFRDMFVASRGRYSGGNVMRTSGYFGSRLAAALAVYELKYAENRRSVEELFSDSRGAETAIREYAACLTEALRTKLKAIAGNISLYSESSVIGAYLLPTTLQIAYYSENFDEVNAVYFWAGDSRAYAWDERGLTRVTDDHADDEVMTNMVNLSREFMLEGRGFSFKKPCMLINATDGCYKCGKFTTQANMENAIMEVFAASDGRKAAAANFAKLFSSIGRHDDSNTMAVGIFGYGGYGKFCESARARSDELKAKHSQNLSENTEDANVFSETDEILLGTVLSEGNDWIYDLDAVYEFVAGKMAEENSTSPQVNDSDKQAVYYPRNCDKVSCNACSAESDAFSEKERNKVLRYWRTRKKSLIKTIWQRHRSILPKDIIVRIERRTEHAEKE